VNIVVRTAAGRFIVRPDTTREKNGEDFWLPDDVTEVTWSPVFFVRLSRSGKAIGKRFAVRYYDLWSCGVLLYPEDYIGRCEEGFAIASCMDRTTYLPMPTNPVEGLQDAGRLSLSADDVEIFSAALPTKEKIDEAIAEASKRTLLRASDYLCMELRPRTLLFSRNSEATELRMEVLLDGASLMAFRIKA